MAETFYDREGGHTFFPPEIQPGSHGSIDLHWDLQKFKLSINIPASPEQFTSCQGTDSHGVEIKWELGHPEDYATMAWWMKYA
jgi:hypothetical protein